MATTDTPASDAPDPHFLQPGDSVDFDLSAFSPAADADAHEPIGFPDQPGETNETDENAAPATEEADAAPSTADLFGLVAVAPVAEPIPAEELTEEEPKFAPGETIHDVATVRGMY